MTLRADPSRDAPQPRASQTRRALILFAHGARNQEWAQPVEAAQAAFARHLPETTVAVAFLEFLSPTLDEVIAALAEDHQEIAILPWFIAAGGHLQRDLPERVATLQERHPHLQIAIHPAVGTVDAVIDAMVAAAVASLPLFPGQAKGR